MPTIIIPVTTYAIRSSKPSQPFGSPAAIQAVTNAARMMIRVPFDRIPVDATITSAILSLFSDRASAGAKNTSVYPVTSDWNASVTWNNQPTIGTLIQSVNFTDPPSQHEWNFTVTTWAQTRNRRGLKVHSSTAAPGHWLEGSASAQNKPYLTVTYTVKADTPSNLKPDGDVGHASVSTATPILTYAGDPDMTDQKIEFSTDGTEGGITYTYGFAAASEGYYDPAEDPGANPSLTNHGAGIYWRATTRGPEGDSDPSPWAYYEYDSLPTVTITNPPDPTDDGTPVLTWTVAGGNQESWRAVLKQGAQEKDSHDWADEAATRNWQPTHGVRVPSDTGQFDLWVRDDYDRVSAVGAPTVVHETQSFSTILPSGATGVIDTIDVDLGGGVVPRIHGTRALGTPDYVSLYRDDVQVPLWAPDGDVYPGWAPGADFFNGDDFVIRDFTANLREEHEWHVRVKTGGVASNKGPSVTGLFTTDDVWLVDPRENDQIKVYGLNQRPVVEQTVAENTIIHTPLNGGLLVEPKRRRITRTTKQGTIQGAVINTDDAILDAWVAAGSNLKYRLIFGRVNWSIILGDYIPVEQFYPDRCGPDRVQIAYNWWQRRSDI